MKKTLITNICLVALSAMVLVFLALPVVTGFSGYECFQLLGYLGGMDFGLALFYVSPLIILISATVTLVASVLGLLVNLNVLKNEKLLKVARMVNLIAAAILGLFGVLAFVLLLANGGSPAVGIILVLISCVAATVCAVLEKVWTKKQ